MKSVRDFFNRAGAQAGERTLLESEAREFRTPSEILPQILKVIFFAGLGFLNYRLFSKTVPGFWGHATGVVAVMAEAIALYSTHNFSRSSGWFRLTLGLSGTVLMLFAIAHSTFSFLDLVGAAEVSPTVHAYARLVAFPLLASLLGLSVVAITMTHPRNTVRLEQAAAHTATLTGRARAASTLSVMRAQAIIDAAQLEHQKEKNQRERELLAELAKQLRTEQEKIDLIAAIPHKDLREKLAHEFGIDLSALPSPEADGLAERHYPRLRPGQLPANPQQRRINPLSPAEATAKDQTDPKA